MQRRQLVKALLAAMLARGRIASKEIRKAIDHEIQAWQRGLVEHRRHTDGLGPRTDPTYPAAQLLDPVVLTNPDHCVRKLSAETKILRHGARPSNQEILPTRQSGTAARAQGDESAALQWSDDRLRFLSSDCR